MIKRSNLEANWTRIAPTSATLAKPCIKTNLSFSRVEVPSVRTCLLFSSFGCGSPNKPTFGAMAKTYLIGKGRCGIALCSFVTPVLVLFVHCALQEALDPVESSGPFLPHKLPPSVVSLSMNHVSPKPNFPVSTPCPLFSSSHASSTYESFNPVLVRKEYPCYGPKSSKKQRCELKTVWLYLSGKRCVYTWMVLPLQNWRVFTLLKLLLSGAKWGKRESTRWCGGYDGGVMDRSSACALR